MSPGAAGSGPARVAAADCGDCQGELRRILEQETLVVRFRPIASLHECAVFGHVGEVAGPQDAVLRQADRLFAAAARAGEMRRLMRLALLLPLRSFARAGVDGRLFLPLPGAAAMLPGADLVAMLAAALAEAKLPADRIVAVLPAFGWSGRADETGRAGAVVSALRGLGVATGGTGVGCGREEAHVWRDGPPDFALLDAGHFDGIDADLVGGGRFAAELERAGARGVRAVALGVGGSRELRVVERLGIDLVGGDYFGRAGAEPARILPAAASRLIRRAASAASGGDPGFIHLLERLKIDVPAVTRETAAEAVFATFERSPQLRAVAVVDDGIPVGIISRYEMIDNMARPYRHELYGKRSCTRFMDREPIVADLRLTLTELTDTLVHADPRHLVSGFIVTDRGRYVGMGLVQDLMREITALQIEAARYANPLTQLPGSVPVNQQVDSLLAARQPFVLCYCDLDHFKPFNDVYGYARGDAVIGLTARILGECCERDLDMVGHVGGDDFILVMRSDDWVRRCERALQLFAEEILGYFSRDDIEHGGYVTENRKGEPEFHRLVTLSIGVVEVAAGQFASHLQVAAVAAEVKKKAKAIAGNSLYINRRHYEAGPSDG